MHDQLERWTEWGKAPDLTTEHGRCAVAGLDLIPPPQVAIAEQAFEFTYQGVVYNGRIDLMFGYQAGETITIGDHKTIGDLACAKTVAQLEDDPQRVIYSAWASQKFGVRNVRAAWIYYRRKRPKAKRVDLAEPSSRTWDRMRALHKRVGLPLLAAKQITTPHAFPRSLDQCHLYPPHGCPFKAECLQGADPLILASHALQRSRRR